MAGSVLVVVVVEDACIQDVHGHKSLKKNCAGALDGQQLLANEGSKNSARTGHSTSKRTECEKWRQYRRKTTPTTAR